MKYKLIGLMILDATCYAEHWMAQHTADQFTTYSNGVIYWWMLP